MAILRVLFRRGTPGRLRLMALANVFACSFVVFMTLMTTAVGYFFIVPTVFSDDDRTASIHRWLITYLFINTCGNFILCVWTDTSTARAERKLTQPRRNVTGKKNSADGNAQHRVSVRKPSSDKNSKCNDMSDAIQESLEIDLTGSSSESKNGSASTTMNSPSNSRSDDTSSPTKASIKGQSEEINNSPRLSGQPKKSSPPKTSSNASSTNPSSPRRLSKDVSDSSRTDSANSSCIQATSSSRAAANKSSSADAAKSSSAGKPERSHACKLCEKRVLRRDHHCFFMTVCIGYYNHKHFIFFCLYMMIGALYGVVYTAKFLALVYKVRFWGPQTFLLLLVRMLYSLFFEGMIPPPVFSYLLYQLYVGLIVGLTAAGFLYWHLAITFKGQTTYEATNGDTRYGRRLTTNINDVFGRFWLLLFLLPLPLPQAGDGRHYRAASAVAAGDARDKNKADVAPAKKVDENTASARNQKSKGQDAKNRNPDGPTKNHNPVDEGVKRKSSLPICDDSVDGVVSPKDAARAEGKIKVRERRVGSGRARGNSKSKSNKWNTYF